MNTWIDFDSPIYALACAVDGNQWNYKGRSWDHKAVAISALEAEGKDPSGLYLTKTPEPWDKVERTICKYCDDVINNLEDPFNTTLIVGGGGNFRYDIATIQPYKGNRIAEKPYHFDAVKEFIVEKYGAKKVYGVETDDAIGILAKPGDLIISQDKDLLQLPGNHKHPISGKEQTISVIEGLRSFYSQVITGDTSDSIPGLYGVGGGSAYVKSIKKMDTEVDMYDLVMKLYSQRFGSYSSMFLKENMMLLWLLRGDDAPKYYWQDQLLIDAPFYYQLFNEENIFKDGK